MINSMTKRSKKCNNAGSCLRVRGNRQCLYSADTFVNLIGAQIGETIGRVSKYSNCSSPILNEKDFAA